ncbi:hypothetical protein Q3G72_017542 [Acer saccharum]|nr:hypothetical protein Q3G72_017542 [Acer saccharum]
MEAIFPDASHGICVYHLAQNLKRFCKQRDDVMWLYYCAAYAYRIEDFDCFMVSADSSHTPTPSLTPHTDTLKAPLSPAGRRRSAIFRRSSSTRSSSLVHLSVNCREIMREATANPTVPKSIKMELHFVMEFMNEHDFVYGPLCPVQNGSVKADCFQLCRTSSSQASAHHAVANGHQSSP